MGSVPVKHFDYLVEHTSDLQRALGYGTLAKDIDHWRRFGLEYPEGPLVGCRKIVEAALKKLTAPLPDKRMNLQEIIEYAEDEGTIDRIMALKCNEIRIKGNKGAHEMTVKAVDAKEVLELLDDFLRWYARELQLIPANSKNGQPSDPIFIVESSEEVDEMAKKARIAAALDKDRSIEKKAREVKNEVETCNASAKSDLEKMEDLIKQAKELGISAEARGDKKTIATQQALFEGFENKIDLMNAERQVARERLIKVNTRIEDILSEHDFIRKLLQGDGQATVEQHGVMVFPRGANTVTNILQIAGGAGTGKTLCLLAKLISEVDEGGQTRLYGEAGKKALFICFNKGLANYVRDIMKHYEGFKPNIDIESYDEFVNQLVRKHPKSGFEWVERYAKDAKYERATIIYASNDEYTELLKQAQAMVARRHLDRANDYYFNSNDEDELNWLKEELAWIEARFLTDADALKDYPKASRIGRGRKHQPNEQMRLIILEIKRELNRLLEEDGRYTIEQATKRLLNTDDLPKYDAIAIDEVQDFSLLSIRLMLRFRKSNSSRVFLSGDENQKIYQRDFTWKELDTDLRGYTITLRKNMRNYPAIRHFSDRLIGIECPYEDAKDMVHIVDADEARTIGLLRKLISQAPQQTTALITGRRRDWERMLQAARVPYAKTAAGMILTPGLYILGDYMGKGLEFDNVVVDYMREASEDAEGERRLRYVHFTRARRRLYIRYQGTPPKLLAEYYSDFL